MELIKQIISKILSSAYQHLGAALLISAMFMALLNYARTIGARQVVKEWLSGFKKDAQFRRTFFFVFFTAMLLLRTVLCRTIWGGPLKNVIGIWGIYDDEGNLCVDAILNAILFVPFIFLMYMCLRDKIFGKKRISAAECIGKAAAISFCTSLSIELCQLFLKLGEFQLSDLFYNTLGGLAGGLIYFIACGRGKRK